MNWLLKKDVADKIFCRNNKSYFNIAWNLNSKKNWKSALLDFTTAKW